MNIRERTDFAKTAIGRVFNDPEASVEDKRKALRQLGQEIEFYLQGLPAERSALTDYLWSTLRPGQGNERGEGKK